MGSWRWPGHTRFASIDDRHRRNRTHSSYRRRRPRRRSPRTRKKRSGRLQWWGSSRRAPRAHRKRPPPTNTRPHRSEQSLPDLVRTLRSSPRRHWCERHPGRQPAPALPRSDHHPAHAESGKTERTPTEVTRLQPGRPCHSSSKRGGLHAREQGTRPAVLVRGRRARGDASISVQCGVLHGGRVGRRLSTSPDDSLATFAATTNPAPRRRTPVPSPAGRVPSRWPRRRRSARSCRRRRRS